MSLDLQTAAPPIAEPDRLGTLVGSYKLLSVLGEGAMGCVYLAEHTVIQRKVALKMLRRQHANDPLAVQRFFAEARAVNRIAHENIVEITDFIENPGGDNCFIMELLRGESLKQRLDRQSPLGLEAGLQIALQIARGLSAVHAASIVHRDLKPDNIYLCERELRRDFVKLLDFGVAKSIDLASEGMMQKTNAGSILGTPEYMSPEQLAGKAVDVRSDIYSFGTLMYEMFTGRRPFEAKSFGELVIKHLTQPPTRPSKLKDLPYALPKSLDDLIMRCLQKSAEARPQTMVEVAHTLENLHGAMTQGQRLAMARPGIGRVAAVIAAMSTLGLFGGLVASALSSRSVDGQTVASANTRVVAVEAPQETALAIETVPAGAHLLLDGQDVGIAPYKTRLPKGDHTIVLSAQGYETLTRTITLGDDAQMLSLGLIKAAVPEPVAVPEAPKHTPKVRPAPKQAPERPKKWVKDTNAVLDPFGD